MHCKQFLFIALAFCHFAYTASSSEETSLYLQAKQSLTQLQEESTTLYPELVSLQNSLGVRLPESFTLVDGTSWYQNHLIHIEKNLAHTLQGVTNIHTTLGAIESKLPFLIEQSLVHHAKRQSLSRTLSLEMDRITQISQDYYKTIQGLHWKQEALLQRLQLSNDSLNLLQLQLDDLLKLGASPATTDTLIHSFYQNWVVFHDYHFELYKVLQSYLDQASNSLEKIKRFNRMRYERSSPISKKVERLKSQYTSQIEEFSLIQSSIKEAQTAVSTSSNGLKEAKESLSTASKTLQSLYLQDELLKQAASELKGEMSRLTAKLQAAKQKELAIIKENDQAQTEKQLLETQLNLFQDKLSAIQARQANKEQALNHILENQGLIERTIQSHEEKKTHLKDQIRKNEEKIAKAKRELIACKSRLSELREQIASLDLPFEKSKERIEQELLSISEQRADLLKQRQQIEESLEILREESSKARLSLDTLSKKQASLQDSLMENQQKLVQKKHLLKKEHLHLKGKEVGLLKLNGELREYEKASINQPHNQAILRSLSILQKNHEQLTSEIQDSRSLITKLDLEITQATKDIQKIQAAQGMTLQQGHSEQKKLKEIQHNIEEKISKLARMNESIASIQENYDLLQNQLSLVAKNLKKMNQDLSNLKEKDLLLQKQYDKVAHYIAAALPQNQSLKEQLSSLQKNLKKELAKHSQINEQTAQIYDELKSFDQSISQLKKTLHSSFENLQATTRKQALTLKELEEAKMQRSFLQNQNRSLEALAEKVSALYSTAPSSSHSAIIDLQHKVDRALSLLKAEETSLTKFEKSLSHTKKQAEQEELFYPESYQQLLSLEPLIEQACTQSYRINSIDFERQKELQDLVQSMHTELSDAHSLMQQVYPLSAEIEIPQKHNKQKSLDLLKGLSFQVRSIKALMESLKDLLAQQVEQSRAQKIDKLPPLELPKEPLSTWHKHYHSLDLSFLFLSSEKLKEAQAYIPKVHEDLSLFSPLQKKYEQLKEKEVQLKEMVRAANFMYSPPISQTSN